MTDAAQILLNDYSWQHELIATLETGLRWLDGASYDLESFRLDAP